MEHQPTTDIQSNEPTTSIQSMQDEIKALQAELLATKEELVKVKYETAAALKQVEAVQAQASIDIESVQKQAAEQLALSKFGLERFSTDNDSIKFYTSFPTYQHIQDFYEFVRPAAETMTYCYASWERESRPGARTMQLIDELFMFLVRLKLGLFEKDLAYRFNKQENNNMVQLPIFFPWKPNDLAIT